MHDDRRKAAASGAASRAYNGGARGKGYREGGEAAHRGGDIKGGEERGRNRREREESTTRRKGSACRSGVGAAPRACVYI